MWVEYCNSSTCVYCMLQTFRLAIATRLDKGDPPYVDPCYRHTCVHNNIKYMQGLPVNTRSKKEGQKIKKISDSHSYPGTYLTRLDSQHDLIIC